MTHGTASATEEEENDKKDSNIDVNRVYSKSDDSSSRRGKRKRYAFRLGRSEKSEEINYCNSELFSFCGGDTRE